MSRSVFFSFVIASVLLLVSPDFVAANQPQWASEPTGATYLLADTQANTADAGGVIQGESSLRHETNLIWQEVEQSWQLFLLKLPAIGIGLLLFVLIFLVARPVSVLLVKPLVYMNHSQLVTLVTRRLLSFLVILFGFYLFLRFAGLSEFAVAVLSGTGVMGLIIGFAFKDIAENFIASLLLSIQKPFKIDDVIEVDGRLGVVNQVTARATTLVDFDGDHIQIPNATVYKNIIRNVTANPKSRGKFVIGIGYDSSIIESQKIALRVLTQTDSVLSDPEPQVLVDVLASSTVNLKVYFWINSHEHSLLKVSSYLMRTIMREFEQHGISMPDDAREIIFPQGIVVHQADDTHKTLHQSTALPNNAKAAKHHDDLHSQGAVDDLSSDAADIRQQAKEARDPEKGQNIL